MVGRRFTVAVRFEVELTGPRWGLLPLLGFLYASRSSAIELARSLRRRSKKQKGPKHGRGA